MEEWINILDSLPEIHTFVIAMEHDGEIYKLKPINDANGWIVWHDTEGYSYLGVTHWLPLPPQPKDK